MKTKIIPAVVGALGMIKKGTQKYVNEIPENLSLAGIKRSCSYENPFRTLIYITKKTFIIFI